MPNFGCTSSVHQAHVDNTAQGNLHATYLASNAPNSRLHTVKKHVKTNVFSLAPQCHTALGGSPEFGRDYRWKIGRQGDYLINNWIRAEISSVKMGSTNARTLPTGLFMRWTHNIGHNLFEDIELAFSQVPGASFDEFYMDFFSAFSVPAGKRNMYDNMIGNLPELVNPIFDHAGNTNLQVLPAFTLNVPLPLPYTRDIGIALPTGALIYNEVTVSVCLRRWEDLLIISNASSTAAGGLAPGYSRSAIRSDVDEPPRIELLQLWGNYVVVTSDERKRMGRVPRDMIWEIIQTASDTSIQTPTSSAVAYLRYSHAVKTLFFACRNTSVPSQLSNYTTRQAVCYSNGTLSMTEFPSPTAFDPIAGVVLKYEGADRLNMPADFFSMVQPYYFGYSAPTITGYHVFSYSTNFVNIDHAGSTDYGKLTNVSLEVELSRDAQAALTGHVIPAGSLPFYSDTGAPSAWPTIHPDQHLEGVNGVAGTINGAGGFNAQKQTFELKNCCLAHTVVRSIGGGIGFPIF